MTTFNSVFVLDTTKKPLTPCAPARARALLRDGKAAVWRTVPFTIILKAAMPDAVVKLLSCKIDPGSKTTGIALVDDDNRVLFAAELEHRGKAIKAALDSRRSLRRGRRGRKTRYRAARFNNRVRAENWLPPSLQHRVETTMTWVNRFRRWADIAEIAVERVKFDMQQMNNPNIAGVEYQQGTLAGYSAREYLLEKWGRKCAYCGAEHVPLQIEHIKPRAKGGTNNISNLTLACEPCNTRKGTKDITVFLKNKPDVLKRVLAQLKKPLTDAAAVNATRNKLFTDLLKTGLPVETGTGAQTKFNRTRLDYPKAHWIDAACVGESGATVTLDPDMKPLLIKATGHGTRQTVRPDKYGFPRGGAGRVKRVHDFQTGDLVRLNQPKGKYAGEHVGRLAGIRATGMFDIKTELGKITASFKNYTLIQRGDGYAYAH
ncbi:RNA-guided endonuclease IscB (plasmid) [Methylomarinum sp. Ch1-1]|uniref:RNA-guided endonuclease IscB n=1 Tax=Methylomarinum roseum TaxID=3067653 RepID=A0AAU7P1S7_9GAMM|nr:RNA-guided endonuclease IscB [Methylomarinum sp. Ch1-1]MDP4518976.1 RNA-guided endonuclease IscB [Methylomarinum sp. Ch1-1]MDP4519007.1 RNA-guided endonuclease IscB [Methylomarinum sp. Ch1-1]MDP4523374.1 RNA-guided endonuclease IscB [Methylomarinum sp. Ch1-1]MDP4523405.1 RNA-guided endonuclease IscB [Methylomarinum sp. Ch1-1]